MDKDNKTISIRENDVPRIFVHNDQTEFYHGDGKASSLEAFALRKRVLIEGQLDSQGHLVGAYMNLRTWRGRGSHVYRAAVPSSS